MATISVLDTIRSFTEVESRFGIGRSLLKTTGYNLRY
jgi:hypothetical protein